MILSKVFKVTFKGEPAQLVVVRNNGYCWGEMMAGAEQLCVTSTRDIYDLDDEEAAERLIRCARRGSVEPTYTPIEFPAD